MAAGVMFPRSRTLLSVLAGMHRLRRMVALVACIGVLGWSVLAATHRHDASDAGSTHPGGPHCVLCLGSPSGATPPQFPVAHFLPPPPALAVAPPVARAAPAAPVAAYLSRGPPAG
ncbi:MAG: hypothetical protein DIU62_008040 [Pseudomonadota bacterium]|jgi:hypothetical protein|nr:MAG: hypothetical protein DIU62_05735 [Pseudomonadota bacterium]